MRQRRKAVARRAVELLELDAHVHDEIDRGEDLEPRRERPPVRRARDPVVVVGVGDEAARGKLERRRAACCAFVKCQPSSWSCAAARMPHATD